MSQTIVARLACDEPTARAIVDLCADAAEHMVGAAFEEDGRWQVAIHFHDAADEDTVRDMVRRAAGDDAARKLRIDCIDGIDWVAQSLAGLPPVRAGRFVVHGAHDRARIPVNAVAIEIEAALAFGTGHHGTTRGCLMALDMLAKRMRRAPVPAPARGRDKKKRVLDIGTGSGVLAIAAARRLHVPVTASDIDRQAVAAAKANARLNRAATMIRFVHAAGAQTRAIAAHAPYDLILANILLGPLLRLAVPIRRLCARRGTVVLSGLLPAHAAAVLAAYRAQGFHLRRRIPLEGWTTLVLTR